MAWFNRVAGGLRALWRRDRLEQEMDEELRAFFDAAVDDGIRQGMTREQAIRVARLAVGSETSVKQAVRETGWEAHLESVWRDAAYAIRSFSRSPGFTAVAVMTLAIGIAATTAIFSVVHAVLLDPLPYKDSERMVRLLMNAPPAESPSKRQFRGAPGLTAAQIDEIRTRVRTLSHVGTAGGVLRGLRGKEEAARVQGAGVSASVFDIIDAVPARGRRFTADDEAAGAEPVIILSDAAWRRWFNADPNILGTVITMDSSLGPRVEYSYTVIGVMPPEFAYPDRITMFWLPFQRTMPTGAPRTGSLVARLADGASPEAAVAELEPLLRAFRPEARETRYELAYEHGLVVEPVRPALLVLMAAVGFVLLIACVNVANLLLARTAARQREMALRAAIGASRGRLIRQMLTESVLLAVVGGTLGSVLAVGAVRLLKSLATTMTRIDVSPGAFPRIENVGVDPSVLGFTMLCSLVTGVLFGLAPALLHSQIDPVRSLRGEDAAVRRSPFGLINLRHALVVAEVGLAMVLLVGGGLLARSFLNLSSVRPGYNAENVVTFQVSLPHSRYPNPRLRTFAEDLVARLRSLPGVESAAYSNQLPMVNLSDTAGGLWPTPDPKRAPTPIGPDARFVSRDYLQVFGIRVLAGRGLTDQDGEGRKKVLLVNQALVNSEFSGESPIGKTVFVGRDVEPWEIVGIVEDVRQFGLDREPAPQFFADLRQFSGQGAFFPIGAYYAVRANAGAETLLPAIRAVIKELDEEAALFSFAPMSAVVANTIARPRLYASLLGSFAFAGLVLAMIGIYGVMSYAVTQRTREIGIRMSLGAAHQDVLGLVLRQSMTLTAIGIVLGLAGAAAASRYLTAMLFGVTGLDVTTFVTVALTFMVVAALAAYIPARRATRVDPLVALRCD